MRAILPWTMILLHAATVAAAAALGGLSVSSCTSANVTTGEDRPGQDMGQIPNISTVPQCAALCCERFRCRGFVHVANAPSDFGSCVENVSCCYLKNGAVDPVPSSLPSISTGTVSRQMPSPRTLWSAPFGNGTISIPSRSSPFVDSRHVYVGVGTSLVAFDRATGSRIWSVETDGNVESSPSASESGRVVFGSVDGSVRSINASTGVVLWTFASGASILSSPLTIRSTDSESGTASVIFGNSEGVLYSLAASSGAVLWSLETNGSIVGTGVFDETERSILIGTIGDGSFILGAVDVQSGIAKWRQGDVLMPFCSLGLVTTPALSCDGRSLFLTCQRSGGNSHTGGGSSFAIRADITDAPGAPLDIVWNASFGTVAGRSPTLSLSGKTLYVSTGSDIHALNTKDGTFLWTQDDVGTNLSPMSRSFDSAAGAGEEVIAVGTAEGDVIALNSSSGAVVWASLGMDPNGVFAAPTYADGVLYAPGASELIAYNVSEGSFREE